MMTNKEKLKKKIVYRSTHRGSKEMDILLGSFVKKNIDFFNIEELYLLEKVVLIEDEILSNWYFNKSNELLVPPNKVSIMLKNYKV